MTAIRASSLGANQIEVRHGENAFLISHKTPVAAYIKGKFYRTNEKFSRTTSKHINKWLDGAVVTFVPQSQIETWMGW